ncbi:MAG: sigma-70 family RNA polymerase sigma factor [Planctomycetes bacterium]|jgi:RNA polymerase sigma-70 factor (ECF subfamily)|nr:sigma-70 family RNA polymerase sigma factor [Planctomycetota bacterium]MCL4729250.1 sigma-70 family RNA polymerase sigma factor [Planctomycetota bacterium]
MRAVTTREEQLVEWMRRHQTDVWRFLRMLGCDRALADDLTQDVFLYVLDHPVADFGPAATAAYLRKTARNLYLNWLRDHRRELPLGLEAQSEAAWAELTPGDGSDQRLAALRRCLDKLADRQRRALDLRYRDGLSDAETAQAMQATPDAIKGLLKRTREQLRQCVQQQVKP